MFDRVKTAFRYDTERWEESTLFKFCLCLASVFSSVFLILANKRLMTHYEFDMIFTLSSVHFLFTFLYSYFTAVNISDESKSKFHTWDIVTLALAGTGSIVLMNFNLLTNSVGVYQLSKLACIPTMIAITYFSSNTRISGKSAFSLLLILMGVGVATVTDVQLTEKGLLYASAAVLITSRFQIWQGSRQKEYGISAIQITSLVMPYQTVFTFILALLLEIPFARIKLSYELLFFILLTCVGAVAVNIITYSLIKSTSAITFQVVGHFKTLCTLMFGMYFFPAMHTNENIMGISLALVGMILYGFAKN
jgi:drug/metabolite transporter (DMT)-like permease